MADKASDDVRAQQPRKATVESVEEEIARARQRLSVTLIQLNDDVRALLDPKIPVSLAPIDHREAAHTAAGPRSAGRNSALARFRKARPLGILTAVTGLTVFLFRSGIARRVWNRKKR